ncbi:MAG: PEGA domain-containing protein [Methanoregula sp.]|jgi:hypothetical protein
MIREILTLIVFSVLLAGCITDTPSEIPPETGTIQLTSSPSGAEVYLDNESQGPTPVMILNIVPGNHTIEYRMTGFRCWTETITVPSGTSHFFSALTAETASQPTIKKPTPTKATPAQVTVKAAKSQMLVGDSEVFSGTATGTSGVSLTLFGPGYYENGILLDKVKPNAAGLWSYTWSPGTKIQSGSYTLVAGDTGKTTSVNVKFLVIGNGEVTVNMNRYSLSKGDTVSFFGICTTRAPSVKLTLFGPGKYTSGAVIGTLSVTSDNAWSFQYPVDKTMLTGTYTISVSDVPKTSTSSTQFTIGYVS